MEIYNHLHILISGKECSLSPPTSAHSIITSTGNGSSGAYLCGEVVSYQCEECYEISPNVTTASITCQENKLFSGTAPHCNSKQNYQECIIFDVLNMS